MLRINRMNYDISTAFPQIRDFPVYDNASTRVAVLVRLFGMSDNVPLSTNLIALALWSMRSHMLNSDMARHQPSVIFHIEDNYTKAHGICLNWRAYQTTKLLYFQAI